MSLTRLVSWHLFEYIFFNFLLIMAYFYFNYPIWNILKVLVSHQKFWIFLLKSCFLPKKSHKTWKKQKKKFRLSRAVAVAASPLTEICATPTAKTIRFYRVQQVRFSSEKCCQIYPRMKFLEQNHYFVQFFSTNFIIEQNWWHFCSALLHFKDN
jgi:hypothetical protein